MTRVALLTGASGFIGRQAVPALLSHGFEVHTVGRRSTGDALDRRSTHHCADLMDAGAVAEVMRQVKPSHLLHLAWDVTHGTFWESRTNLDWVASSLRLYRAFTAEGGKAMVAAGTCAEYDWSEGQLDEDTPLKPATLYGQAKHSLHVLLRTAAASDGVTLGWGRVFLLYGPHESPERLVSGVTQRLLAGEPAPIGNEALLRDFMHVGDVADGLALMLAAEHDGALNVASGLPVSIGDVAAQIGRATGRSDLIQLNARPSPPGEKPVLVANGERLRTLGFTPKWPLEAGIANTVAWWEGQR